MPKPIDPAMLPEPVASFAAARVASGRYASVADVFVAGVEALAACEQAESEWFDYAWDAVHEGDAVRAAGRTTDMSAAAFSSWLRALPAEPAPVCVNKDVACNHAARADFVRYYRGFIGETEMSKPFDPASLPDDVARAAAAQVAAGRFPDVAAVLRAGVQAVERQAQRQAAKLEQLRAALIEGEQSGIAPVGSFDRARAHIRELATRRTP